MLEVDEEVPGAVHPSASFHPDDADADDAESQPLRTLSREGLADGVEDFATAHGLQHKLDHLQKAALLLRGESAEASYLADDEIEALCRETTHKWRQPKLLYFTIVVCSLGAVEQGWVEVSMNGANLDFPAALGVGSASARDAFIVGLINCGLYLSVGLWGAWLAEPLNNRRGRRGAIFAGSVLCLLGNLGCAASGSWPVLLACRLLLGTGLGIVASTVSVYAAECAPAPIRGGLAVSWQMWVAFGVFLGFLANVAVYDWGPSAWRLQLAAPFLPAVPTLLLVYLCPESPAWYVKTGRWDLAYQALARLRNVELQAARELYAAHLQAQARATSADSATAPTFFGKLRELFAVPRIRNASLAAGTVMLAQQLCGINILAFYSSTIFRNAGFSAFGALVASCVFGLVNFLGAFPAVWTMDTLGRRALLLWTLPFMALTMLAAGLSFRLPEGNVQFGALAVLVYLFCAECMGPVPCAYSAEVFPLSHREVGMSFAVATANFWAAVLSLTFPGLLSGIGSEGSFELYAALNVLALLLVFLFVRETKQKTLDELDEVFAVELTAYVRFVTMEQLPWMWRRYILRKRDGEYVPTMESRKYMSVGQDEVDALDQS